MADLGSAFAQGGVVGQINKRAEQNIKRKGLEVQRSGVEQRRSAAEATARAEQVTDLREDTKLLLELGKASIAQANTPEKLVEAKKFMSGQFDDVIKRANQNGLPTSALMTAQNNLANALSSRQAVIEKGVTEGLGGAAKIVSETAALAPVFGAGRAAEAVGVPVPPEVATARAADIAGASERARQEAARETREEAALGITLSPEAQTRLDTAPVKQRRVLRAELSAEAAANQGNFEAAREFRGLAKVIADRQAAESDLGPRATARERAIGTQEARTPGRIRSIKGTIAAIDKVFNIVSDDPTAVGFFSKLRQTGQAVVEFLSEFKPTSGIVENLSNFVTDNTELSKEETRGFFNNPNLSQLKLLENQIGLALARLEHSAEGRTDRIPVGLIKLSINSVKLAGLTSGAAIKRRLTQIRERFVTAQTGLETQFGGQPSTLATPPAIQQPLPTFNVTPDGLQRVE